MSIAVDSRLRKLPHRGVRCKVAVAAAAVANVSDLVAAAAFAYCRGCRLRDVFVLRTATVWARHEQRLPVGNTGMYTCAHAHCPLEPVSVVTDLILASVMRTVGAMCRRTCVHVHMRHETAAPECEHNVDRFGGSLLARRHAGA